MIRTGFRVRAGYVHDRVAHPVAHPVGPAGSPLAVRTPSRERRVASGLVSVAFHLATVTALIWLIGRTVRPVPAEQSAMAMVFAPAPPPVAEPVAETPPDSSTPEPPPPEPPTPEPVVPPAPAEVPPPNPKPLPMPPPKVAKPVQRAAVPRRTEPTVAGPSVSAPAPVATVAAPANTPVVDPSWQSRVAGWLAAHKNYPEDARRKGEEGRVAVRFTVARSGQVLDAEVATSSGSERLDAATVALLRGASLPPFPASMVHDRITITTSMRYTLR